MTCLWKLDARLPIHQLKLSSAVGTDNPPTEWLSLEWFTFLICHGSFSVLLQERLIPRLRLPLTAVQEGSGSCWSLPTLALASHSQPFSPETHISWVFLWPDVPVVLSSFVPRVSLDQNHVFFFKAYFVDQKKKKYMRRKNEIPLDFWGLFWIHIQNHHMSCASRHHFLWRLSSLLSDYKIRQFTNIWNPSLLLFPCHSVEKLMFLAAYLEFCGLWICCKKAKKGDF